MEVPLLIENSHGVDRVCGSFCKIGKGFPGSNT